MNKTLLKVADHVLRTLVGLGVLFVLLTFGYVVTYLFPVPDTEDAPVLIKAIMGNLIVAGSSIMLGMVGRFCWFIGSLLMGRDLR